MIKTGSQVEHDFFVAIKSSIKAIITGEVYNSTGRTTDSKQEDAVVNFLTGKDGQIQEGVVIVNVFIPDIFPDGQKGRPVKNTKRCREIESEIARIIDTANLPEYHISRSDMIQSFKHIERPEHFVSARIYFKRIIN